MSENRPRRWEDEFRRWRKERQVPRRLEHAPHVSEAVLTAGLWACPEPVDWGGELGKGLLVSTWDTCYEGRVRAYSWVAKEKGPLTVRCIGDLDEVFGLVTAARIDDHLYLVGCSRTRERPLVWRQTFPGSLSFDGPIEVSMPVPWVDGEFPHIARLVDWFGDGRYHLLVGTDYWGDYWPDGKEWFEPGYRPWNEDGTWRGGPLRGRLYILQPESSGYVGAFEKASPVLVDGQPLEVYGAAAPAVRMEPGHGVVDLFCGDFLDRIYRFSRSQPFEFVAEGPVRGLDGKELSFEHCIHIPSWLELDRERQGLLVGDEDGHITFLRESKGAFDMDQTLMESTPHLQAPAMAVAAAGTLRVESAEDLVVGVSSGYLVYYASAQTDESPPSYEAPTRLRADGEEVRLYAGLPGTVQGPAEVKFGYTSPVLFDWDGDELLDLIVTDSRGLHFFLKNIGTKREPRFGNPALLMIDGKPLETVWRSRPAPFRVGDRTYYLSLDHEGVLTLFEQKDVHVVSRLKHVNDESGLPIRFTEDHGGGLGRIKLALVDWYGRGVLDLLVGTHARASVFPGPNGIPRHSHGQATVLLLPNVATTDQPVYGRPRQLCWNRQPLMLGMHACSPEPVHWSGSLPDLIVAVESGSLLYYPHAELSLE